MITFADVVHQSITFDSNDPSERLILSLIDTEWFQRLRDISQTANTRLVYMFSEHSRFGHSLGVAYLAKLTLEKLATKHPKEVAEFRSAILAAALLHDIGHIAPGSHTAFKTWFPGKEDCHEELAVNIINNSKEVSLILDNFSSEIKKTISKIIREDSSLPNWTWQLISGGGWNVDRGNWCTVDSVLAGVNYGRYNIPALVDSITITAEGDLALNENRLDAMMHFMVSRHAMYRQIYQHRVLLASDMLDRSIVQRARDLKGEISFADPTMKKVLLIDNPEDLDLETIFQMRECWWRYHLLRWRNDPDLILRDLSNRLLNRKLFKTVRTLSGENKDVLEKRIHEILSSLQLDPKYYLHEISTTDVHSGDSKQSMLVQLDDGSVLNLLEADSMIAAMSNEAKLSKRTWLAVPDIVKEKLNRKR